MPSRLIRYQQRQQARKDDQPARNIDRNSSRQVRIERNNRRNHAKHARRGRREAVAGAAVLGGEDLGGDGVQDTVHDVAEEHVSAVPPEQRVRRARRRRREEERAGEPWITREVVE